MQNSTLIIVIVAILVLGAGGFWYMTMGPGMPQSPATVNVNTSSNNTTNTNNSGQTSTTTEGGTTTTGINAGVTVGSNTPLAATVTLTDNGFTPQHITIKKGGTVTWVNESDGNMWVGSAMHPTHTAYDGTTLSEHCDDVTGTSFDQCKNSDRYSFTFDKVGKWNYHNHSASSQFGSVTVVE